MKLITSRQRRAGAGYERATYATFAAPGKTNLVEVGGDAQLARRWRGDGRKAAEQGRPIVSLASGSRIQIGARCVLCSDSRATALGINHPVVLRTMRPGAAIIIGADTGISGASICAAIQVKIGDHCLLGANVTIADTDFHALAAPNRRYNTRQEDIAVKPVHIGNNVFLGAGVIVLKGVSIGDNAIIGAGSVVTRDVPPNVIAAGNPAHVVRQLT